MLCSVDQQLTVLGDPGFRLQDDCKKVTFPNGPTTLLANQIVGDPSASDSHCEGSYWTFEMSGNSAWACGLVPVSQTVSGNKKVLWDRDESIGLHYQGVGSSLPEIKAPKGVVVTVFVDFASKICKFCCDGVVVVVKAVPEAEFPLRLGICGHNGSIFNMKPDKVNLELLILAQVGDSIFSADELLASKASPLPVQARARGGGAVGGASVAASQKYAKELTYMRLEFSSAHEFDLWQKALLYVHPNIEMMQPPISSTPLSLNAQSRQDAQGTEQRESLNLQFSFIPDTRPLCEERYAFILVTQSYHMQPASTNNFCEAAMCAWSVYGLGKVLDPLIAFVPYNASFRIFRFRDSCIARCKNCFTRKIESKTDSCAQNQ